MSYWELGKATLEKGGLSLIWVSFLGRRIWLIQETKESVFDDKGIRFDKQMSFSRVAFPNLKYSHYTVGWETLLEVQPNLQNSQR